MNTSSRSLRVGGVPEHFNLPWKLAIENGAFAKVGLQIQFDEFPGGTGQMTRALRDEDLDVALVLTEGAVADILKGGSNKIVNVYVDSPLIWGIHVAAESPIATIDQAAGKRYAISRNGSGSHLIAIVDASIRGWPVKEMEFVKVGNLENARKALAEGTADIFFWERFMTQPLVDSREFRRIAERIVPWPSFVASVRQEILDERRDAIRETFEIINRTCKSLMNNPDAESLIAERYELKLDDSREWFSHVEWSTNLELDTSPFTTVVDALIELNIVDANAANSIKFWEKL